MPSKLKKQIFRDSVINLFSNVISRFGTIIFTIILARIMLPGQFGIYSLAISIPLLFATIIDLGINQTMTRFVSSEKTKSAYFQYLLKLKFIILIVFSIMLIVLSYPISKYIFNKTDLVLPLIFATIFTFIISLSSFFEPLFFIHKNAKYIAVKEIILQSSKILLVILAYSIVSAAYIILGVISSLVLSSLIVLLFLLYYSRKEHFYLYNEKQTDFDKKRIFKFLFYLTLSSFTAVVFSYIDTLMIGIFLNAEFIGYYRVAFSLVFGLAGFLTFTNIFLPLLSRTKKVNLQNIFNQLLKYSFILTIPSVVGLIFISPYAIKLIYGNNYLSAALPLYFLAPLIFFSASVGIFLNLFSALEDTKKFAGLTIFVTVLNVILNFILIKSLLQYSQLWAATGAAIATLVSWAVYFIGTIYLAKKDFMFNINISTVFKPLIASVLMGIFLFLFNLKVVDMSLIKGMVEIAVAVLIYFTALFTIKGLNKDDLHLFLSFVKNII